MTNPIRKRIDAMREHAAEAEDLLRSAIERPTGQRMATRADLEQAKVTALLSISPSRPVIAENQKPPEPPAPVTEPVTEQVPDPEPVPDVQPDPVSAPTRATRTQ